MAQANVISKSITNNVATLTTDVAHGYSLFTSIVATNVDQPPDGSDPLPHIFNGAWIVTALTSTTLSFPIVSPDYPLTNCGGTVVDAPDTECAKVRLCQMEEEILPGSKAAPVAYYWQEDYPFWTNRTERFTLVQDGQGFYVVTYRIVARMVLAAMQEDYNQNAELKLDKTLAPAIDFLMKRSYLQCTIAPYGIANLDPEGILVVDGDIKYGALNTGTGANQFGAEIAIEIPFKHASDQLYSDTISM